MPHFSDRLVLSNRSLLKQTRQRVFFIGTFGRLRIAFFFWTQPFLQVGVFRTNCNGVVESRSAVSPRTIQVKLGMEPQFIFGCQIVSIEQLNLPSKEICFFHRVSCVFFSCLKKNCYSLKKNCYFSSVFVFFFVVSFC